jgi:hypothetical protein
MFRMPSRWKRRSDGKRGRQEIEPSCLPLFPQTLEIAKRGDFAHSTARLLQRYTDISNGRAPLSFLMSTNRTCRRKVEMSGFCKVEMSILPFRR